MHDLVIRGGTVVDGTGSPARTADVIVDDGVIVEVGRASGGARRLLDADGLLVTPGWVDVHTHYDGQVFWDPLLTPSSWNGVTTVVMGNCGVGFAPARPDHHEWLIDLMTAIEDIPTDTLRKGIPWGWESFPEYMDCLDLIPRAVDVGVLVPHGAARGFVMGERSIRGIASPSEIAAIMTLLRDGMKAGALGCSMNHMTVKRAVVPGTFAPDEELLAVAGVVGEFGGVLQTSPAGFLGESPAGTAEREIDLMRQLSLAGGSCTVTFPVNQYEDEPDFWRRILQWCNDANHLGARLVPQVHGRPLNTIASLRSRTIFDGSPTFTQYRPLPLSERLAHLRRPDVRAQILAEMATADRGRYRMDLLFPMQDPPDYEPLPDHSVDAIARRQGRPVDEVFYDMLVGQDGESTFLAISMNYAKRNGDVVLELIEHPMTLVGQGDGGAHCLTLCDATAPTTVLTQWVRDRTRGRRLSLERAVYELARNPARHFGLPDRGELVPGLRADINIIDFDRLQLGRMEFLDDLPGGAHRVVQRTKGYVATIVCGEIIFDDGADTGARPGRTIRHSAKAREH
jgi:N-acyl-D-aspartate/D-glutamate deacylase